LRAIKIYEALDFERGQNPKEAMGIGVSAAIKSWMESLYFGYGYDIPKYRINDDLTIDLFDDFIVPNKKLHKFPDYINFNICHGNFMIDNCEVESLRGCPNRITGFFSCEGNNLQSLDGMPSVVFGDIYVRDNPGKFKESDVLERTQNLSGRKIYSENTHANESLDFERVRTGSRSEILGKAGIGNSRVMITWGKYNGKTVGEVYAADPQYILWLSKNGTPRKGQEELFSEVQRLADQYWKDLEADRLKQGSEFYGSPGDIFEGIVKIIYAKYSSGEYGDSYLFRAESGKWRFQFYMNYSAIASGLGINEGWYPQRSYHRTTASDNLSDETKILINQKAQNLVGKEIQIKGKVKYHKEVLGIKYTWINFVKILGVNEAQNFQRGQDPHKAMNIGREALLINSLNDIAVKSGLERAEVNSVGYESPYKFTIAEWRDKYGDELCLMSGEDGTGYELFIMNYEDASDKWIGYENILNVIRSGKIEEFFAG
jgi:hypothetical protein